jgi:hypothetical protein
MSSLCDWQRTKEEEEEKPSKAKQAKTRQAIPL